MTEKTVVNCCDFFGRIWPECSLFDLTDGSISVIQIHHINKHKRIKSIGF